jgi:hypothetical protein
VGKTVIEQPRPGEQLRYRDARGQVHTIRYPVRAVRAPAQATQAGAATESP